MKFLITMSVWKEALLLLLNCFPDLFNCSCDPNFISKSFHKSLSGDILYRTTEVHPLKPDHKLLPSCHHPTYINRAGFQNGAYGLLSLCFSQSHRIQHGSLWKDISIRYISYRSLAPIQGFAELNTG